MSNMIDVTAEITDALTNIATRMLVAKNLHEMECYRRAFLSLWADYPDIELHFNFSEIS